MSYRSDYPAEPPYRLPRRVSSRSVIRAGGGGAAVMLCYSPQGRGGGGGGIAGSESCPRAPPCRRTADGAGSITPAGAALGRVSSADRPAPGQVSTDQLPGQDSGQTSCQARSAQTSYCQARSAQTSCQARPGRHRPAARSNPVGPAQQYI